MFCWLWVVFGFGTNMIDGWMKEASVGVLA